jgi:outer membrane lipoprotein SlyB
MAAQVYRKKSVYNPAEDSETTNVLGGLGMAIGGIAGGISGGAPGAVAGMQSGKNTGKFIGENISPSRDSVEEYGTNVEKTEKSAIQRRMELQTKDTLSSLKEGAMALTQMSPEMRKEYSAPIVQAILAAEKEKAMGRN